MRKRQIHVQKQTHKNNFRFFDRDHDSLKGLDLCFESYDRSQIPAQTTIPCKIINHNLQRK